MAFEHDQYADSETVKGFRQLPSSWFYKCLAIVIVVWVLSMAELVCLWRIGVLL